MKSVKGSAVAFAVAVALSGSALATEVVDCAKDIGFTTDTRIVNPANFDPSNQVGLQTGVWQAITLAQMNGAFSGKPQDGECIVPKNAKGKQVVVGVPVPAPFNDQCSMYQSLGSANQKLAESKLTEAIGILDTLASKAATLSIPNRKGETKLTAAGAQAITLKIDAALYCIAALGQ